MKQILIVFGILLVLSITAAFLFSEFIIAQLAANNVVPAEHAVTVTEDERDSKSGTPATPSTSDSPPLPERTTIAENLTIPWDIVFLDDGRMLVSERSGTIVIVDPDSGTSTEIEVPGVIHQGEGGLLGMAAHPDFDQNRLVYLYRTSGATADTSASVNEVVRYTFTGRALEDPEMIVDGIPGALYHNGGRIAFGPDGMLYIATGDAREPDLSQDRQSRAGKILRVTPDGDVPGDNPFADSSVYSLGHRNPQGLTWDAAGRLWSTEHGRSGPARTGMDELNLIEAGGNYGWPESEGDRVGSGTIGPRIHSGPDVTWAPASALYWDGSIFFGGLRGATLYEAVLDGTEVVELRKHFPGQFGRIRSIVLGSDGGFYLTTSNRDNRGEVAPGDDRIIRLNPEQFRQ